MVTGLETFRDAFHAHTDQYLLIGGVACDILMDEAGLAFRATKDMDIVLTMEAFHPSFVRSFWDYVRAGGYETWQSAEGKKGYFRFLRPRDSRYPFMLELFSRRPDLLVLPTGVRVAPVRLPDDASSLSVILMDDVYYTFLHEGKRLSGGIAIAGPERLIALKARAWIDLTERKRAGDPIDGKTITKHRNDVFRLSQLLRLDGRIPTPPRIQSDLATFLNAMTSENNDIRHLGIRSRDALQVISDIKAVYSLP